MDDPFLDFSTIGYSEVGFTSQCGGEGQGLEGPKSSHNCKINKDIQLKHT